MEGPDGRGKVGVGIPAAEEPSNEWKEVRLVQVADASNEGIGRPAEFQAYHAPSWAHHASHFAQCLGRVCHIPNAEAHRGTMKAVRLVGKSQSVGQHHTNAPTRSLAHLGNALSHHGAAEIRAYHQARRAQSFIQFQCEVSRSGAHIQGKLPWLHLGETNRRAPPCFVPIEAQERVQQVISPGDGGKHASHGLGMLAGIGDR